MLPFLPADGDHKLALSFLPALRPFLLVRVGCFFLSFIWQRVAQVIVNVLDFGMSVQDAVEVPRFSYGGPQETGTSIEPVWRVEERVAPAVVEELRRMGHRIELVPEERGMVNGITRDPGTGALRGGADPRGRSYAIGY